MPHTRKYKCLNPECPGTGRKDDTGLFIAMNNPMPECPCCGSVKLDDWGECHGQIGPYLSTPASYGARPGIARRIDGELRRQADRYGMTDMNNRDGGPAKMAPNAPSQGKYGNMNVGGVQVPIGDSPVTVSDASNFKAFGSANTKIPGFQHRSVPRQVVAEHRGNA